MIAERLAMPDAEVLFYRAFFAGPVADALFKELLETTSWKQEALKLYGKMIDLPRLTAWYGDPGKTYRYSNLHLHPELWTPPLLAVKRDIEAVSGVVFNSVLLNLYRGGRDSVSWHSDDEPELGTDPVIGSVSFGEARAFQFRHKRDRKRRLRVELTHGSYLLMRGPTQHHWLHQVPKDPAAHGPRVNLTFRIIR
jgi:alkylated DNA repair dioxygenase AlkB